MNVVLVSFAFLLGCLWAISRSKLVKGEPYLATEADYLVFEKEASIKKPLLTASQVQLLKNVTPKHADTEAGIAGEPNHEEHDARLKRITYHSVRG